MQSQNRPYLPQVDEIRAYAALLVLFFHCLVVGYWSQGHQGWIAVSNPLEAFVVEGHSGVALFMVLSGYILALGVWDRPIDYWGFLRNRVVRIFPLMTALAVAAIYTTKGVTLTQALAPFILLQNVQSLALNDPAHLLGVAWTISVEFQFYLVAPFVFRFVRRQGIAGFVLPFAASVMLLRLCLSIMNRDDHDFLWQFPALTIVGHIDQFVFGVVLAEGWHRLVEGARGRGAAVGAGLTCLGLVGMALLSVIENAEGGQYVWRWWRVALPEIEGLLWAAFIAGYVLLNPLHRFPVMQLIVRSVGLVSFSIYLLHWPIMQGFYAAIPAAGVTLPASLWGLAALAAGVVLPLVLAASTLSYWSIERPFLQMRKRYVASTTEQAM